MLGKLIDWTFDLIGLLWNGFWNVFGKLCGLTLFMAICGVAGAAIVNLYGGSSSEAWLWFKGGIVFGFVIGGVRLLINEVAVPLVHDQLRRSQAEARQKIDDDLAKARVVRERRSRHKRPITLD